MNANNYRLALPLALLSLTPLARAANDTWTGGGADNNWQTAANWLSAATPTAGDSLLFSGATQLNANNNFNVGTAFGGLTFTANAGSFTLTGNSVAASAGITNRSLNWEAINLPLAFAATHTLNVVPGGTLAVGGVISGAGGVTVAGGGAVILTNNNTFTGATTLNAGTLTNDFTGGAANNIINAASPLSLGGGTLVINGSSSVASSQTFASTALASGASSISAASASGPNPTVALKAITPSVGASIVFNGPATTNALTGTTVPATATLTTTTAGTATAGAFGILIGGNNNNAYATVGLYDWATTDTSAGAAGSSPYTILGGSQVSGFYTVIANASNTSLTAYSNLDFTTQQTPVGVGGTVNNVRFSLTGTTAINTIRYNSGNAPYATVKSGTYLNVGGILITPNMGSVNAALDGLRLQGTACQIVQNNTAAVFILGDNLGGQGPFFSNSSSTAEVVVKSGAGTWVIDPTVDNIPVNYINSGGSLTTVASAYYNYANNASGTYAPFYFNGGVTLFNNPNVFGNPTAASTAAGGVGTINLNGGILMSHNNNVTLTYPNISGTPNRYVFLGNNGGGLAAASNTTFTVNGVVGGIGSLTIGIPASSANGFDVTGLVPGTGGSTANPAFNGVGTVILGGVNSFSGGVTILGGATLIINSEYALGGANYGGLTFNNGTLQYSNTLLNAITDVSLNTVTLAGNGTIDVNGHAVTLANAIGNNGPGALTAFSSAANGSLNLAGANAYSGGTFVTNCTLLVNNTNGSATGSGNVTLLAGSPTTAGVLGGNGIISGIVEVQANATLAPGLSGVGTNTVGSLQLDAGSLLNVGFNGTVNSKEVVTVSGGLTINGGVVYLYQAGSTTAFSTPGTYNLIQFNGGINGSVDSLTVGNPQTGFVYTFGTSGQYVTLQITTSSTVDIGVWTAAANGNWSSAANWTSVVGTMPPHNPGDSATFGVGSALRTVTLDANESVGGVVLTNANSFVIASAGKTLTLDNKGAGAAVNVTGGGANVIQTAIALNDNTTVSVNAGDVLAISGVVANAANSGNLTLNVAGTLALSGNNSYGPAAGTTGTTLSGGGTLQLGNNNALGAGDVAIAGNNALQAAASLTVPNTFTLGAGVAAVLDNNGNNLTLSGTLASSDSSSSIACNGSGVLTLTGNGTFSGALAVNGGVLSLPSANPLNGGGPVVLNGGDLLGTGSFGLYNNLGIGQAGGTVGTNALIDAAGGQTVQLSGVIASAGNTGANGLLINSRAGHTGAILLGGVNTFSGTTVIDNGILQLENSAALQSSTLVYNNQGGALVFDVATATFGALTGSQPLALTNLSTAGVALTVGNNGGITTYSGSLSDAGATSGSGALTLAGGGLKLTGTSSFGGALTVGGGILTNAGILHVGSASVNAVGGAQLVVSGSLTATNASNIGSGSLGLLVAGGSVVYDGNLTTTANKDIDIQILVPSGSLSVGSLYLHRGANYSSTQPTAAFTTDFYINGGTVNIATNLDMCTGAELSSAYARMDSGSLTVGGTVTVGLDNGGRWSCLDINGGTFTVNDTNTGVALGSTYAGNTAMLVRNGTSSVGRIGLGNGAVVDTAVLQVTGGALYVGAGGIAAVGTASANVVNFYGGIVGALTNWSSSVSVNVSNTATLQAADAAGNPQNILLSGGLYGPGNLLKSGAGILTLANTNAYVGGTTVSNGELLVVAPANLTGPNFTAFTLATTNSVLDLTSAGYYAADGVTLVTNSTLYLTNLSETLTAVGTLHGALVASNGTTVAIGTPAAPTGSFTVSQRVELAGAVTFNLNRTSPSTAGELIASTVVVDPTATLTVANVGSDLQAGDTFRLFSAGHAGHFGVTNLPVLASGMIWSNTLASNGRLAVVQTKATNPTNITFSVTGSTLSLAWPADHAGWTLQAQTNSIGGGLGTNWVDIAGSATATSATITVDPAKPTVFYRLRF